jgi:hypothetical protein
VDEQFLCIAFADQAFQEAPTVMDYRYNINIVFGNVLIDSFNEIFIVDYFKHQFAT